MFQIPYSSLFLKINGESLNQLLGILFQDIPDSALGKNKIPCIYIEQLSCTYFFCLHNIATFILSSICFSLELRDSFPDHYVELFLFLQIEISCKFFWIKWVLIVLILNISSVALRAKLFQQHAVM